MATSINQARMFKSFANSTISPRTIYDFLSRDIVGQRDVKIAISVGLHNHMLRTSAASSVGSTDGNSIKGGLADAIKVRSGKLIYPVRLDKTNILLLGPTGISWCDNHGLPG